MRTVILDPVPVEIDELVERRRRLGLDRYDEVWEGVYHMAPAPHPHHGIVELELARVLRPYAEAVGLTPTGPSNLGQPGDFRVPDQGYLRGVPGAAFVPTAALVIEIVSPGDETWDKLPFYSARGVEEVMVVELGERRVRVLAGDGAGYRETPRSEVLGVDLATLTAAVNWPS